MEENEEIDEISYYIKNNQLPERVKKLHISNQYRFKKKAEAYEEKNGKILNKETGNELIRIEDREERVVKEFKEYPASSRVIYDRLRGAGISRREVEEKVKSLVPNQLHKALPPKLVIKHVVANKYADRFQADIVDMSKYSWHNNGYNYMLTVIDIHSRRAWIFKLKTKGTVEVINNIKPLLISEKVKSLHTDNGSEFKSNQFMDMCKTLGVRQIFGLPYTPNSQGHIERFNRTIKTMLFKYFTINKTKIWISILEQFVDNYNNTVHSVTKEKPISKTAQRNHRPDKKIVIPVAKRYNVGDKVRIALRSTTEYKKKKFQKTYLQQWSDEIYEIINSKGLMYRVRNINNDKEKLWISHDNLQVIPGVIEITPAQRGGREAHLERLHVTKDQMREPNVNLPTESLLESRRSNPRVRKPNVRLRDL